MHSSFCISAPRWAFPERRAILSSSGADEQGEGCQNRCNGPEGDLSFLHRPSATPLTVISKLKKLALKLGLSFVVLMIAMELTLRLMGYANGPSQYYDPDIGFRFFPNQERYLVGPKGEKLADMITNEMGYRGPWYAEPKPEGVQRVFCLGDSFTFGWGVAGEDAFPIQMQALLAQRATAAGGKPAQVYNLGVPGYNTSNELNTYLQHARPLQPDVVVLSYFQNDLQPDMGGPRYTDSFLFKVMGKTAIADAFHKHLRRKIPLFNAGRTPEMKAYAQFYKEHVVQTRENPKHPESRPYWDDSMGALRDLVQAVRSDGAKIMLVVFPGAHQVATGRKLLDSGGVEAVGDAAAFPMQAELRAVADELELPMLDLILPFAQSKAKAFGELDNTHPSAHGYLFSSRLIVERLVELGYL
ncbi:MAG: lysophospholipase L1-like esterase [Planctomycetota bacterium]|jgi:lysophospholipase L1-like esterase